MLVGMVRTKCAALLIGPIGIGVLFNLTAIQALVEIISGGGIHSSSVRDIAQASASNNLNSMARTIVTIRRVCWVTGIVGGVVIALLSGLISRWTFNDEAYANQIALLGIAILFSNLYGGQMAVLQGTRRIGDIARINILSSIAGASLATVSYYVLRENGIIPAILGVSFINLLISWQFSRRVPVPTIQMTWFESLCSAGSMIKLGVAFMWSSLMVSLVTYLTNLLLTRQISLEAVGIYSAAFTLSGVFINFVLSAMGSDYYPRLAGVAGNHQKLKKIVNEQTEIGMLLAFPGVLVTLVLAPWVINIFYSAEFLRAEILLQWFVLGCFIRVIQWPMGFLQQALGRARWLFFTQTTLNALHFIFIMIGLQLFGLEGAAIAFFAMYLVAFGVIKLTAWNLIRFQWSSATLHLILYQASLIAAVFIAMRILPSIPAIIFGACMIMLAMVQSLRGIAFRVGESHPVIVLANRIPGFRMLLKNPLI
jgi:PST family polysaccharide transporter